MNQIGDLKTFHVLGSPPVYPDPIYVWKFQWDGSVLVTGTESGSVQKRLNLGGNPAEGGSAPFVVPFRCDICDQLGNVVQVVTSTVPVNNPPTIVGAPSITPNNQAFPFQPTIKINAYDLENNGVGFFWFYGTSPIGGKDATPAPSVTVQGTYAGTLTGLTRDLYTNTFTPTVYGSGTVYTCKIVDGDNGTTRINVPIQGFDPGAPQFSVAAQPNSLVADASTLPTQRIAPGQTVLFTTYASDSNPGRLVFTWYLYGTNGWNAPGIPVVSFGTRTALADGNWRGDLLRAIDQETGDGVRTAVVSITNSATGKSVFSSLPVTLVENHAPVIESVGIYDSSGLQIDTITRGPATEPTVVRFSGTASDVDTDVLYYRWNFTTPGTPVLLTLYGRDAFVDIATWPASSQGIAYPTLGVVTAIDRYGVPSAQFDIPQLVVMS